jgi:hypothetical protein
MSSINNIPPLTFNEFMSIPNGTRVFNYGADQCVALANQYHVGTLGGTLRETYIQSAYQWWTDFERYPQFYNVYDKVTSNPQRGDIFVTTRSPMYDPVHGHIGVVERSWDGSTFGTMEQNAGSGAKRWVWRYTRDMKSIAGFLRPKNNPNPSPPSKRGKQKMATLYYCAEIETWALAGDGQGEAAWLETKGKGLANDWSNWFGGPNVIINKKTWDAWKAQYIAGAGGSSSSGGSSSVAGVDYEKLAKAIFDEQAKRLQS